MRVAVVGEETTHHGGGEATDRRDRQAALLAARGHDVRLFCARWWDGEESSYEVDAVTHQAITNDLDAPDRRFAFRLSRALYSFDPDVIHAASTPALAVLTAAFSSTLRRTPLIVDWYDHTLAYGWEGRLHQLALRAPDLVVTPSRLIQTRVREAGRSGRRTDVIPTGIDFEAIRAAKPNRVADVVYSRPLDGSSNVESLLLALAELRELGWTAAVIGDGPSRRQYEEQAADLRIDDRIEFMGGLSLDERLAVFKGAHVAVHTAKHAPFAVDFLRALACGCVGIAEYHANSSAHELVEHRDRGFRTTSEDELVDTIRSAADLPRKEIDESYAEFDETNILERYLDRYRRLQAWYEA